MNEYKNLHIEAGLFKKIMLPVSNLVEHRLSGLKTGC